KTEKHGPSKAPGSPAGGSCCPAIPAQNGCSGPEKRTDRRGASVLRGGGTDQGLTARSRCGSEQALFGRCQRWLAEVHLAPPCRRVRECRTSRYLRGSRMPRASQG